jgi:RimJ/RimL family protein N-acetyltransferase
MVTVPERLANSGRFELLPVYAGCVAELFEAVAESKNEISPWMEWCDADYSIEATKQWVDSRSQAWEQDKEYGFLIVDARSKQVLGTCGINQYRHIEALIEPGKPRFSRPFWGQSGRPRPFRAIKKGSSEP